MNNEKKITQLAPQKMVQDDDQDSTPPPNSVEGVALSQGVEMKKNSLREVKLFNIQTGHFSVSKSTEPIE